MQLYSLPTTIAALLFILGLFICLYWSRPEKPKNGKGPAAIILLAIILLSGCTREVASGVYPVKRWAGYRVVRQIPLDSGDCCGYTKYVIRNDKRFIELYAPEWFGKVYAIGDTIK